MKNFFYYIAILFFSGNSFAQQVVLDFEKHNGYTYEFVSNSVKRMTSAKVIDNTIKDAINSSDRVLEFNYGVGGDVWDYVGFTALGGESGFNLNNVQGKIFKIKFLSKKATNFSLSLRLHHDNTKIDLVKEFKNISLDKWYETEFDFSDTPDMFITRIDPWFQDGAKNDGDVYWIDDLFESVTPSLNKVVETKPEPVKSKAKKVYRKK